MTKPERHYVECPACKRQIALSRWGRISTHYGLRDRINTCVGAGLEPTCEHLTDSTPCAQPAPHLSADRRRPVCGEHREEVTA